MQAVGLTEAVNTSPNSLHKRGVNALPELGTIVAGHARWATGPPRFAGSPGT